ncbi:MAG: hypothetical protein Q8909_01215 [Bacteroidota bacterium]|nr:hypothetical protein [Bacteroidota bacterium]
MVKEKKESFFWTSYSDLMTSLFFVMLVLFVLTVVLLKKRAIASEEAIKRVNEVTEGLKKLNKQYYSYDDVTKRYKLNVDIQFLPNQAIIESANGFRPNEDNLIKAGRDLYSLMNSITKKNANINYLLIVEGNTQRSQNNFRLRPDVGYKLSYERALALVNFWKKSHIDFDEFKNCEILICGSGYFGKSRTPMRGITDPASNRKFSIQITPKIGKIEI